MSLTEVSSILWRERELLELLVFKLEEEQLLLAAGRARWLTFATREVEMVLAEIKRSELGRAGDAGAGPVHPGLPPGAGRGRAAPLAAREGEMVLAEIKRSELGRAVEVDAVAVQLGLPAGISLRELAERVPAPWDHILKEHRTAFLALSDEVTELARTNRELLAAGFR